MSLSKFLDLLSKRSLFLAQLSSLRAADPFEGSLGNDRLQYLERVMADDDFARQELHVPAGEEIPADRRASYAPSNARWQYSREAERSYINCWHINGVESASLWSIYTNQGEGVAIQSSVGALVSSLGELAKNLTIAPVRYIDHQTFKLGPFFETAAFYKRLSFQAEKELRIQHIMPFDQCIQQVGDKQFWQPPTGVHTPVDCSILIEKIYISPTLGPWFAETVQDVVGRLGLEKSVVKSSLSDARIL